MSIASGGSEPERTAPDEIVIVEAVCDGEAEEPLESVKPGDEEMDAPSAPPVLEILDHVSTLHASREAGNGSESSDFLSHAPREARDGSEVDDFTKLAPREGGFGSEGNDFALQESREEGNASQVVDSTLQDSREGKDESEEDKCRLGMASEIGDGSNDRAAAGTEATSSVEILELGENVMVLRCKSNAAGGQCFVYIVGTAHVSQDSCDEVQAVIRGVKPQVVFLELCDSRRTMVLPQKLQVPTFEEMFHMYRRKGMNPFGIIYSWFLARVALKLEVFPGAEFRVAYEEAVACGARVVLGDRPVQITLRRTWASMSFWHKTKLIFALIFQGFFMPNAEDLNHMVEDMKDSDMITAIIFEMSKTFPSLMDTLVHERDMYMAAALRGVAQSFSTIVAVVGKGHLLGISNNWGKDISIAALLTVPKKKRSWYSKPVVQWGTLALAVGGLAIFVGVHFNQKS